ncbi:MAG: Rieske 2Fe-2S domain-containing protein [Bacteroidota bacterium]|nr:Rieske 2Fe-2S domain-containing protein [Bacteroidota bacterium]
MIFKKKHRWVRVAKNFSELHFGENNLVEIDIDGKKVCLANTQSGIKACASRCPHAGGNMAEGKLDAKGNIVCTVHKYHFNLSDGRDIGGEGYFLKIYPVKEDEEGIFVGMEEIAFD